MEDDEDETNSEDALMTFFAAVPAATCWLTGAPWFAAVHLPLLIVGTATSAPPAITLTFSTLLYTAGDSLFDEDSAALLATAAVNLAFIALLTAFGPARPTSSESEVSTSTSFADWDAELRERERALPWYERGPLGRARAKMRRRRRQRDEPGT